LGYLLSTTVFRSAGNSQESDAAARPAGTNAKVVKRSEKPRKNLGRLILNTIARTGTNFAAQLNGGTKD
jgi:hypothetical protein